MGYSVIADFGRFDWLLILHQVEAGISLVDKVLHIEHNYDFRLLYCTLDWITFLERITPLEFHFGVVGTGFIQVRARVYMVCDIDTWV